MTVLVLERLCLAVAVCASLITADIYLHVPRGSNNRLNEKSAARKNANRMFDSQNNNRGGYNVGDSGTAASSDESGQYRMKYFQSDASAESVLTVEWTNQHGCGGNEDSNPQKQNCVLVLQYACQDDVTDARGGPDTFRNGKETTTAKYTKPTSMTDAGTKKSGDVNRNRGLHESWDWYNKCYMRERNKGLFTADQNLKANNGFGYSSAIYTRQNPNGNQYGYECPEERDYYPYWHPTMWKDIAVMAENSSMCSHYTSKSFNVQPYGECVEAKGWSQWRTQADCQANGGQWVLLHNYLEKAPQYTSKRSCERARSGTVTYVWGVPYDATDYNQQQCLAKLPAPQCFEAPWSRSNHLGNGADGKALTYDWKLPYFPSGETKRCVFRMRYNVSTDDYDPYHTDHTKNNDLMIKSPVQQNPYVNIGGKSSPLRLAINTAQYGRIFQDRSHVFKLRPRPQELQGSRIFNVNVRGKRGNIVQVYPAVEYDFAPTHLEIREGDLVHVQWTGSNSHNNGNPAGDGQAGSDGEGTAGTDRNNMVQIRDRNDNFPVPFEQSRMWTNAEIKWIYHGKTGVQAKDLAVDLASAGYYRCIRSADCQSHGATVQDFAVDEKSKLQSQLNNAPASYEGVVLKFRKGTYHYMCTRNNNFTNRSQKGTIVCK
ncbi:protein DD3-3-like [Babylonia areolata]|uniref:protein DD3-3-like n=1 Tax=Babylonia areolata TaxID=304850 RepID=UPI003FD0A7E2